MCYCIHSLYPTLYHHSSNSMNSQLLPQFIPDLNKKPHQITYWFGALLRSVVLSPPTSFPKRTYFWPYGCGFSAIGWWPLINQRKNCWRVQKCCRWHGLGATLYVPDSISLSICAQPLQEYYISSLEKESLLLFKLLLHYILSVGINLRVKFNANFVPFWRVRGSY